MNAHHRIYDKCQIHSYAEAASFFNRARSAKRGRPYGKWGLVTRSQAADQFDGQPVYNVLVYGKLVCTIAPDNKLTLCINGTDGSKISNTLSSALYKLVPINWCRAAKRRYRILSTGGLTPTSNFWLEAKAAPELFDGLELDLTTHQFTNAVPDILTRVDPDKRKVWLRALRKFKAQMAVRAKLGVFDSIAADVSSRPTKYPDWNDTKWLDMLYNAMRDEVYPRELLAAFVMSIGRIYWTHTAKNVTMAVKIPTVVQSIIDANSVELRARFGVFNDE